MSVTISAELAAAYHDLYETVLLHTAPEDAGDGFCRISGEDQDEIDQACYAIQHLLTEEPS